MTIATEPTKALTKPYDDPSSAPGVISPPITTTITSPPASTSSNPFTPLLQQSLADPTFQRTLHSTHRDTRNRTQSTLLLSTPTITPDPILSTLLRLTPPTHSRTLAPPSTPSTDPRHCLVFWARPPSHIRTLIAKIQQKLLAHAPPNTLWLMPEPCLHMTVLEAFHSVTEPEVTAAVEAAGVEGLRRVCETAREMEVVLEAPGLGYDAGAVAVSFLPREGGRGYVGLREEMWRRCKEVGVEVRSRYVLPSAHVTVARYVGGEGWREGGLERWVKGLGEVEGWLRELEVEEGRWRVGAERGVECRIGRLWYGGGERVVAAEAL